MGEHGPGIGIGRNFIPAAEDRARLQRQAHAVGARDRPCAVDALDLPGGIGREGRLAGHQQSHQPGGGERHPQVPGAIPQNGAGTGVLISAKEPHRFPPVLGLARPRRVRPLHQKRGKHAMQSK